MSDDVFGLLGTTIGTSYRVDEVVGEGGFGVVYKGFHLRLGHPIAVKCLKVPPHFTPEAKNLFYDKFCEEGEFLSRLSEHPSIVRVFDRGLTPCPFGGKVPYLVLEWLDGAELEATMLDARKRGRPPMSEADAVALMGPAVDAIALAHTMKIAHRDLKPANLYQARTARGLVVKVLDFGIAKAMQEGETATVLATKTASGFSAFTPQYGAPEQFIQKKYGATGPWTDVHALGLILSELVSGRPAYEGEEHGEFTLACFSGVRPTPRALGARVSDRFEALVAKALAMQPRDRFQDAGELLAAMGALGGGAREANGAGGATVAGTPSMAAPGAGGTQIAGATERKAATQPSIPRAPEVKRAGKMPGWAVAAIVAGVGVVGVVAAGVVVRSAPKQTTGSAVYVKLQPGTFTMGSPDSETGRSSDEVQHRVTITRAFELKETEVTQGEWQELMGSNPSGFKDCGANCPVEQVSWYDAIAYCNALSVKAGLERCYKDGATDYDAGSASSKTTPDWPKGLDCAGYRLPTEAEWEYAARAGRASAVYANLGEAAWYDGNSGGKTHAVKQKQGNAWGLYDMLGNVWEWTWDGYASYSGGEQRDPTGPAAGAGRVRRGGSWYYGARGARAAYRFAFAPDGQSDDLGFRLARGQ